ncbi:MAG: hypothetical protein HC824_21515, partial [Synechococcales cyanobacterium RM1_1_8]|nr:hypothetical protein [Synechococcales cyanobacterium RM1_1_8]
MGDAVEGGFVAVGRLKALEVAIGDDLTSDELGDRLLVAVAGYMEGGEGFIQPVGFVADVGEAQADAENDGQEEQGFEPGG